MVREILNELPRQLHEEYERTLCKIKSLQSPEYPEHIKYAKKVLLWLTTATRPLTKGELIEAMCIDETAHSSSIANSEMLLQACDSFVSKKENGSVVLSHFSVKVGILLSIKFQTPKNKE